MKLDPRDEARLDILVDQAQRARSRRIWRVWLVIAFASVVLIAVSQLDGIHPYLRATMIVVALIGLALFLVLLSTKRYGHWGEPNSWWF